MPELEFVVEWPGGVRERCYSPSRAIREHLSEGSEYALTEFLARARLGMLILDDGTWAKRPCPVPFRGPNGVSRIGDTVTSLLGVLTQSRVWYAVQPTVDVTFRPGNPRPEVPDVGDGALRVAEFNLKNYFTTFGKRGAKGAADPQKTFAVWG